MDRQLLRSLPARAASARLMPTAASRSVSPGQPPKLPDRRIPELDGLRGLAGLLVLFHHTLQVPTGGFLGVDVFFVLSGFLISSLIFDEIEHAGSLDFAHFYWRRAVRLIPAFVCMVLLYQALRLSFMPGLARIGPRRAAEVLFLSDWVTVTPYLGHAWSLAVEWQFYCVWPAVIAVVMRLGFGRRTVALMAALGVCGLWAATTASGLNLARGSGLFFGSGLACMAGEPWFRRYQDRLGQQYGGRLSGAGVGTTLLLLVTLCFSVSYTSPWIGQWVYVATSILTLIVIILLGTGSTRLSRGLLGNRVMVHFGRISYGLYLYHFPIAAVMASHHFGPRAMLVAGLFVACPLADCSWRYIEQPLLRLENRNRHREAARS